VTRNRRSDLAALAAGLAFLLAGWGGVRARAALNVLFDGFRTAQPGVDVRNAAVAGGGGSNAHVLLADRLLGGDPPDVWQTHPGTDNLFLTVVDTFVMAKNAKDPQNAQAFLATIGAAPTQLVFNK
jgi:ABC-type glycerol-3-phosphate transport system substrate-binding protein